jgi:hypothetical protein
MTCDNRVDRCPLRRIQFLIIIIISRQIKRQLH